MRFEKGQSGNPGGRPKADTALRELARERTQAALDTLTEIMSSERAPAAARIAAACALLDRGWGKPPQSFEHAGREGGPIETREISDAERAKALALLIAKIQAGGAETGNGR